MPNYIEYQKSISKEFKSYENRVRHLIDDVHMGEDGRYKEVILMNYLKRVLPKNLSVGSGFVRNGEITRQIDIIIYDNTYPLLFSEGDFVIANPENVKGIIEVKTTVDKYTLIDVMKKANKNGEIIIGKSKRQIFNGIFSYNSRNCTDILEKFKEVNLYREEVRTHFNELHPKVFDYCINYIALDSEKFIMKWSNDKEGNYTYPYYSLYNFNEELAYGYFISNLLNFLRLEQPRYLTDEEEESLLKFYYPILEGKESKWAGDYCFENSTVKYERNNGMSLPNC